MNKQYLKPEEAADYLGIAPQTLANWRYQGGGPRFIKAGRNVRYDASTLQQWMADRTVSSTSEQVPA